MRAHAIGMKIDGRPPSDEDIAQIKAKKRDAHKKAGRLVIEGRC